jgi:hypothetical protein
VGGERERAALCDADGLLDEDVLRDDEPQDEPLSLLDDERLVDFVKDAVKEPFTESEKRNDADGRGLDELFGEAETASAE